MRQKNLPRLIRELESATLSREDALRAAPMLIDSRACDLILPIVEEAARTGTNSVSILYSLGRRDVLIGQHARARTRLTKARSLITDQTDELLRNRVAFELGCLLLDDGGVEPAQAIAGQTEALGGPVSSDLLHLRALVMERKGNRAEAIDLYRRSIVTGSALSPATTVLAMRNLADTLCHENPDEAVALIRQALELVRAYEIDPRISPALRNGLGYALLCTAALAEAGQELGGAVEESVRLGRPLIQAYALYNQSIVEELTDDIEAAGARISAARRIAEDSDLRDLTTWCAIRLAWLELKAKRPAAARSAFAEARRRAGRSHADAIEALEGFFALIDGDNEVAQHVFAGLSVRYLERRDLLSGFVFQLWRSSALRRGGAAKAAAKAARVACDLRRSHSITVSPSWWAAEVLEALADSPGGRRCSAGLHPTALGVTQAARTSRVEIEAGRIRIDGVELSEDAWEGKAGRRVMGRLLARLEDAYPNGVTRDDLADALWPDSEGDKAIRNLYSATRDLRRVLMSVPGARLLLRRSTYFLVVDSNVRFLRGAASSSSGR